MLYSWTTKGLPLLVWAALYRALIEQLFDTTHEYVRVRKLVAFLVEVSAWPRLTRSTSEYDECKVESSLTSVNVSHYEVRAATLCVCVCVCACRACMCVCVHA